MWLSPFCLHCTESVSSWLCLQWGEEWSLGSYCCAFYSSWGSMIDEWFWLLRKHRTLVPQCRSSSLSLSFSSHRLCYRVLSSLGPTPCLWSMSDCHGRHSNSNLCARTYTKYLSALHGCARLTPAMLLFITLLWIITVAGVSWGHARQAPCACFIYLEAQCSGLGLVLVLVLVLVPSLVCRWGDGGRKG